MENKLEQLLNSLIEKGWLPRGLETKRFDGEMYYAEVFEHYGNGTIFFDGVEYSIRQLVSKESGLWQFVCENGLVNNEKLTHTRISQVEWGLDVNCVRKTTSSNYEYRLIESSLKDESELEDFLLSNIKVEGLEK